MWKESDITDSNLKILEVVHLAGLLYDYLKGLYKKLSYKVYANPFVVQVIIACVHFGLLVVIIHIETPRLSSGRTVDVRTDR